MSDFDPNAAARPGSGVFGLPHTEDDAELILVPVPFDATTSYRAGARHGPAAIRRASQQVDLYDSQTGRVYQRGIHMLAADPRIESLSQRARALAEPLIERGGADPAAATDAAAVASIDASGAEVNELLRARVDDLLARGKLCGVVGGDHSAPFGAILAVAERLSGQGTGQRTGQGTGQRTGQRTGLGILHVDAHADLRPAYEGFAWSHASIMDNVVREIPQVTRIAQVGIRDFSEQELETIRASDGRVLTWFDLDWRRRLGAGEPLAALCDEIVDTLPHDVWVSLDVDGLDPSLCPNTGTPVPGGLSFAELCLLLEALPRGGRRIAGFDLCEVAPDRAATAAADWDANVGARLLYKLCGFCLLTN